MHVTGAGLRHSRRRAAVRADWAEAAAGRAPGKEYDCSLFGKNLW